ncbi:MAG: tRNA 2-selenouridine(34) synthase MnmH [Pseudomonadota bacterium]
MAIISADDFRHLFVNNKPLMDVRAPVEFAEGAFPNAINLPILDDAQRHDIGCVFALSGQEAAIARGLELASPDVRAQRMGAWLLHARRYPDGYLYCYRGGLRSRTAQQWLMEAGVNYPLIEGGYKSMRRFLLGELQRLSESSRLLVVAGATAVGKTDFLLDYGRSIDLEGHANHRGSAFGAMPDSQPSQIDFENAMIIDWIQKDAAGPGPILIEAESRLIGRLNLPAPLQAAMNQAPQVRLLASSYDRLQRLRRDYIQFALDFFLKEQPTPDGAWDKLHKSIQSSFDRIRKRLGGARHQQLSRLLPEAIQLLRSQQDWSGFDVIFKQLLTEYYDKMYDYQLSQQQERVVFTGEHQDLLQWLNEYQCDWSSQILHTGSEVP